MTGEECSVGSLRVLGRVNSRSFSTVCGSGRLRDERGRECDE